MDGDRSPSSATAQAPVAKTIASVDIAKLVRPVALLSLAVMLLARVFAPALKGIASGLGTVIDAVDVAAAVLSQFLAFVVSALCVGLMLAIARNRRVGLLVKILLIPQTTLVVFFGIWASRARLLPMGSALTGLLACAGACVGAWQGLKQPRSRAVGIILGTTAAAAVLHIAAASMLGVLSEARASRLAGVAMTLSTASITVHALSLLVALAWLASRRRTLFPPATMGALTASVLVAWAAARGTHTNAKTWFVLFSRAVDRLAPPAGSLLPQSVAAFVAVLAPALGVAALLTRRQVATAIGALALTLTAGTLVDLPMQAMILALASLAVVLASRDDRGMWEALMGRSLPPSDHKEPSG